MFHITTPQFAIWLSFSKGFTRTTKASASRELSSAFLNRKKKGTMWVSEIRYAREKDNPRWYSSQQNHTHTQTHARVTARSQTQIPPQKNIILLRHPRKHKNACNCSRPGSPDESGGENTKVRAPRMEFLRNALFVFIIGVWSVIVCALAFSPARVCPACVCYYRKKEERERKQEHRSGVWRFIAHAFLYKKHRRESEWSQFRHREERERKNDSRANQKMRQIELIR